MRYLKSGFWPARRFADLRELDEQIDWRDGLCNVRTHASGRFPVAAAGRGAGCATPPPPVRFDWSGYRSAGTDRRLPAPRPLLLPRLQRLVHERVELCFDRDQVWICHRAREVARYRRSYEQGVWLPPLIMRPEPPTLPAPLVLPRIAVTPPELADAELCA